MKKNPTKADIRSEMDQQIDDFLKRGGEVNEVPRGISGRNNNDGPVRESETLFNEPKTGHTYIPDVVAAIDARRGKKSEPAKPKPKQMKKKAILDDFGEPIRWVWVEE